MKLIWRDILACALSGVLIVFCFPRFDASWLAWLALVPWLVALERKRLASAFALSYLVGLIAFTGVFSWIWTLDRFTALDYVLVMALFLPHYFSVWGALYVYVRERSGLPAYIVIPPLWILQEYLRLHAGFLSAPGMLLAHTQHAHEPLLQLASLTGAYGLSFLIIACNAALAHAVIHRASLRALRPAAGVGVLIAGAWIYGLSVLASEEPMDRIRVAVVQGNIAQEVKWDPVHRAEIVAKYMELTRETARRLHPAVIVWPETAVPSDLRFDTRMADALGRLAREADAYLFTGASEYAKIDGKRSNNKYHNSLFGISPAGRVIGQYRKIVLFPFGEYAPLGDIVSWPDSMLTGMGDITPGHEATVFRINGVPIGAAICFEIAFPDRITDLVQGGARLVLNATNEGWFGDSAASYQQFAITRFRAAEHRVTVVRSANSALSGIIDPYGRVMDMIRGPDGQELFMAGTLVADVPISRTPTLYSRWGDVFAFCLIALTAILVLRAVLAHCISVRWQDASAQWRDRSMLSLFRLVALIMMGSGLLQLLGPGMARADEAATLPKGVFQLKTDSNFYFDFSTRFNKNGDLVPYGAGLNRSLNFGAGGTSFGRSTGTITRELTEMYIQGAYGVTNRLSVGFILPYFYMTNRVNVAVDGSPGTGGAQLGFTAAGAACVLGSAGCNQSTVQSVNQLLAAGFGLKPIQTWQRDGPGDLVIGARYQYYTSEDFRAAFTGGVKFPTGASADPDDLISTAQGIGTYAFLLQFQNDYMHQSPGLSKVLGFPNPGEYFINFTARYEARLPSRENIRVCPGGGGLCAASFKEEVWKKAGDVAEFEIGPKIGLFIKGLNFNPYYRFGYKFKDIYRGNRGLDYASIAEQLDNLRTTYEEHIYILSLQYTTTPLYVEGKFPVPMAFNISYRDRFAGRGGVPDSKYIGMTFQVFF